jgi:hypothetical protein
VIVLYTNPNMRSDAPCKFISRTGTTIDIVVDNGQLTLSVKSEASNVLPAEKWALLSTPIHGGIVEARDDGRVVPIFAFQIGDWHWNAPFTLGAESSSRRAELAAALAAGKSTGYKGWSVDFYLVDSRSQRTTARRMAPATPRYWAEAAQHLLLSETTDFISQVIAVNTLCEQLPTDAALFRRARSRYLLT